MTNPNSADLAADRLERRGRVDEATRASSASATGTGRPDPQMQAVLDMLASIGAKPVETLEPKEARKGPTPADAVKKLAKERRLSGKPEEVGKVEDREIPGPAGDIEIRIYTPASARVAGSLPIVVYFHGGGWVIADLDVYDASPRALCNAAHCIVVSSHYRQAPEHTYPAAHDDTFAAYRWTLENARELGGDPARVAVVGESAGGNMAAAVCIQARKEGVQPPVHQVLIYPVADHLPDTPSYRQNQDAKPLSSKGMKWFFEHYLGTPADAGSRRLAILRTDLAGLPPATIISAEIDPLRSEGELLAERFRRAGVPVEQRTWDGVTHEFFGMAPLLDKARDAQRFAGARLRAAFGEG
jgi:acetyl esterase